MDRIRACERDEQATLFAIINAAADAYRGVIPADCWHEPYMPPQKLDDEIAAGVVFWGYQSGGELLGVMGIQAVKDVQLLRHAYVLPAAQNKGVGGALLAHLRGLARQRMLVGTWADEHSAIRFYCRHGFAPVSDNAKTNLLQTYWTVSQRQIEASVVLEATF